jgi:hypothetical protein
VAGTAVTVGRDAIATYGTVVTAAFGKTAVATAMFSVSPPRVVTGCATDCGTGCTFGLGPVSFDILLSFKNITVFIF